MKGQMFIVTMIFLVGLIFAVQGSLSEYAFIDLSQTFLSNDLPLFRGIKNSFQSALVDAGDCEALNRNLQDLSNTIDNMVVSGTIIDVSYSFACMPSRVNVSIHLKSIELDTRETIYLG